MKEFTAKEMHNAPAQVFRAADKAVHTDDRVYITHDHYKDRIFELTARDRQPLEVKDESVD